MPRASNIPPFVSPEPGVFLTEGQAAAKIGVSRETLRKARHAGAVGCTKIGNRARYTLRDVSEFLRQRRQEPVRAQA